MGGGASLDTSVVQVPDSGRAIDADAVGARDLGVAEPSELGPVLRSAGEQAASAARDKVAKRRRRTVCSRSEGPQHRAEYHVPPYGSSQPGSCGLPHGSLPAASDIVSQ
jgi:hypothetical protein